MPLLLRVDSRNQVLIADGRVVLGKAAALGDKPPTSTRCSSAGSTTAGTSGRCAARWRRPRTPTATPRCSTCAGPVTIFDDVSAQLVATATALLNWHDSARFSAVDGSPTKPVKGGWSRVNPVNGHEEFPRIDPAVICLVHDGHDRAVLARQTVWPERLFSLLAGFVEAGESFEVVRRARDRRGDRPDGQRRHVPGQSAVAVPAVADGRLPRHRRSRSRSSRSTTARSPRRRGSPAPRSARRWTHGDWSSDSPSRLLLPGSISIAREIIESWVAQDQAQTTSGRKCEWRAPLCRSRRRAADAQLRLDVARARVGQRRPVGELHRRHRLVAAVDRASTNSAAAGSLSMSTSV